MFDVLRYRSLLNVQYDLKIGGLNSLTYCTYNRDPRVIASLQKFENM